MNGTAYTGNMESSGRFASYLASVKYVFHVIFHPFDGFWDLVHEKRGSIMAAHTFLLLFLVTYVAELLFTSFQFVFTPIQYVNIFQRCGSLLLPFLILCVANWSMTTLFDGKGSFKDIYMGMCYALFPYTLIRLPLVLISNIITYDEAAFYNVLGAIAIIWAVALVFVGLMQIHDYTPGKTFIFLIVTVLGALIIIFLLLVFFSLLSDALAYFVSMYREIVFRLN